MAEALIDRLDRAIDVIVSRGDASAALGDEELAPLAVVAGQLRSCPSASFKAKLRATLERRTAMAVTVEKDLLDAQRREGFTTVTPYLQVTEAGLVDFLTKAFGAVETSTTSGQYGVHREVRIGDSMLMIGEGGAEGTTHARTSFHVFVPDCDAVYERAIAAGGKSIGAPEDRPYGERSGFVEDRFGNYWFIATSLGGSPVPEGSRMVTPYIYPPGVRPYIEFLTRAFGAVEEFVHEVNGRVMHARVHIGDGAIEMGEAQNLRDEWKATFYLYVGDADALYERAVSAGATSLSAPQDMWYGDRVASVRDDAGNTWYIARPA